MRYGENKTRSITHQLISADSYVCMGDHVVKNQYSKRTVHRPAFEETINLQFVQLQVVTHFHQILRRSLVEC